MRNRIAQKLLIYFVIPLLIFAAASGVLFQTLFTRDITADAEQELLARATALADTLSAAADSEGAVTSNNPGMGKGSAGGNAGAGVEAVVISGANAAEALVPDLLSRPPAPRATQALPTHASA